MNVNKVVETPEGTVKFEGELTQEEADLVIKIGLSVLFKNGSLPFVKYDNNEQDDQPLQ